MGILSEEERVVLSYARDKKCDALMQNMVTLVERLVSDAESTAKLFNGPLAGPVAKS